MYLGPASPLPSATRVAVLGEFGGLGLEVEELPVTRRTEAHSKRIADLARGGRFFEDTLRIGRVVDLLNRARVQTEFEDKVVADAPKHIEQKVSELVDWLVEMDLRQWQAVTAHLAERRRKDPRRPHHRS